MNNKLLPIGLNNTPFWRIVQAKGDIKPLQGYKDGRKRLRVGKYRIIYKYEPVGEITVLMILDIDSRGDIYK